MCAHLALLASGCTEPLNTSYGRHNERPMPGSVNGTDVLAGMFSEAGHKVAFRRTLITSNLEETSTIVWFPDDFGPPNETVRDWFDKWLSARAGRTLVYVGRDFDAAPLYWQKATRLVPPDMQAKYRAHQLGEIAFHDRQRSPHASEEVGCDWFSLETDPLEKVQDLAGPWFSGIDAAKTEIELGTQLVPPQQAGRLLTSKDKVLVARHDAWHGGQLITVANGSFLLNMPLVNHEHRKLAGKLIKAVGPPGRVVFLESGTGGPPIDPAAEAITFWQLFGGWPLNVILLHLAVLGIIFCFARWPIFGRPKLPATEGTSDFGKHVAAVGQLLFRSKDRAYALSKLSDDAIPPSTGSK
ncbi:MAG: hypothetical protein HY288_19620 [Planctomycetia bacterium]|nr:hypothetical protein [Planctomycetia bacterium]